MPKTQKACCWHALITCLCLRAKYPTSKASFFKMIVPSFFGHPKANSIAQSSTSSTFLACFSPIYLQLFSICIHVYHIKISISVLLFVRYIKAYFQPSTLWVHPVFSSWFQALSSLVSFSHVAFFESFCLYLQYTFFPINLQYTFNCKSFPS